MSYALDLNVLLLASNTDAPEHAAARAFLERQTVRPELLCLAWPTLMGYLRIATHPSIFARPLSPREAAANVRALLALPQVRPLAEREGFFDVYERITGGQAVRGNLVPDAHLAAILFQHGVTTLYTRDADFRRFDFLDLRAPF
ncbi:MAG TPA: TA system VapC family ribonuclease toxin [Thermoanaerobaculia bacterium]|nr:TA system VapC family ribonuclease toxin [Thermoanaerobaculia bacterium]